MKMVVYTGYDIVCSACIGIGSFVGTDACITPGRIPVYTVVFLKYPEVQNL